MKAKVFAALAAAMAVGAACAFAANPFVDVPADSWAYQSVVELLTPASSKALTGNTSRVSAASPVMKPLKWSPKHGSHGQSVCRTARPHQQIGG